MNEITNEKMFSLLSRLVDSEYWVAIKRFNSLRDIDAKTTLLTNDPIKNPTETVKAQGIIQGVFLLENAALSEYERIRKKMEEDKE